VLGKKTMLGNATLPDMSVTSTWIAPRRWVMASRREASVIEAMVYRVVYVCWGEDAAF
jgi:hypothetical protein